MIIKGDIHTDHRGTIRFINEFNMNKVVRMYCIEPSIGVVRAWQGHKKETKWFYVTKGSFLIKTIDMVTKNKNGYYLKDTESVVLEIPGGYFNGFEALQTGSVLMVFSDFNLEESKKDDWRESLEIINW